MIKIEMNLRKVALGIVLGLTLIPVLVLAQEPPTLKETLMTMGFENIRSLKADTFFTEKYELYIAQPVDHENPDAGTFTQRFFICHRGFDRPVIFVTEGYDAGYAERKDYRSELGYLLEANEIVVEHRYFEESVPKPCDWTYLTVANAAADHHKIIQLMREVYPGKFLSTGISKGGQTALYHRTLYPDDVDATVGYVCPINFSDEDLRVYEFLENTGTADCRETIFEFQKMVLENREASLEAFEKLAKKKKLHYSVGIEKGFELLVLEYSFAFWQWGLTPCGNIPGPETEAAEWIAHIDQVAGLDWVADEGIERVQPFFYQAMTEIGMYGYDLEPFGDLIVALDNGRFDFTCPEGYDCNYHPEMLIEVDMYLRHKAENVMVIYGEWDPWSATAVQWSGIPGLVKVVKPGGSHITRILNLPGEQQDKVIMTLKDWMGEE